MHYRYQEWLQLYKEGKTLREIAYEYRVSHQAVYAALKGGGVEFRKRGGNGQQMTEAESDHIFNIYKQEKSVEAVALVTGVTPSRIRRTIQSRAALPSTIRAGIFPVRYSEQELANCLLKFYSETGSTSAKGYEKYRVDKRLDDGALWPTQQTIRTRLGQGKWSKAVAACGLTPNVRWGGPSPVYAREDCVAAIQSVAAKLERVPTMAEYDIHKAATDPSIKTIRNLLQGWTSALEKAGF